MKRIDGSRRGTVVSAILASLLAYASEVASADTYATIDVEGRGLPQVEGIVRNDPKAEWGFVNFVVFGPGWQFAAQDYAAKEHKIGRASCRERV